MLNSMSPTMLLIVGIILGIFVIPKLRSVVGV